MHLVNILTMTSQYRTSSEIFCANKFLHKNSHLNNNALANAHYNASAGLISLRTARKDVKAFWEYGNLKFKKRSGRPRIKNTLKNRCRLLSLQNDKVVKSNCFATKKLKVSYSTIINI